MPSSQRPASDGSPSRGRLLARPPASAVEAGPVGLVEMPLANGRAGLLDVRARSRSTERLPLAVMLHGAGSTAQRGLDVLPVVPEVPMIVFAPQSEGRTWDLLSGGYGPDLEAIDQGLQDIFSKYPVDASRIAVGGFSDGASYALSVGLTNGDLFTHILAFSPGFAAPAALRGAPRILISHGTTDSVLPIERCSRRIVADLRRSGADVQYREFVGGHSVPSDLAAEATQLLAG